MQFSESLFVTCLTCDKTMKKMFILKFDMDKYSSLENTTLLHMQELPLATPTKMYMCVLQHCNTDVQKDICKMYNKVDYDFTSFVVSQCLGRIKSYKR